MYSSQKSKGRKPIFGRKEQNQDIPLERMCQTTASFLQESVAPSQSQSLPITPQVLYTSSNNNPLLRPQSVAKINVPLQARVFSPQRVVAQPPRAVVLNRPLTAQVQLQVPSSITFDRPIPAREAPAKNQFYQSEPQFYQNFSKIATQNYPSHNLQSQENAVHEKVVRSNQLKPTVVAVERVMKSIGENAATRETTVLKPNLQCLQFSRRIVEPQKIKVYEKVNRRQDSEYDKMSQLQEINSILAQKYDLLYNEVQSLKQQNYVTTEELVIDDSTFIRKAANHFENLLSVEMHKALSEIQSVHKIEKRGGSKVRRQMENSFYR